MAWVMFSEIQFLPPLLRCLAEECWTRTQDRGQGMPWTRTVAETCRKETKWQDKESREYGFSLWSAPDADHPAAWETDIPHLLAGCYLARNDSLYFNKVSYSYFCCLCIKMKTSVIYFIYVSLTCIPSAETRRINIFMTKSFKLSYW